MLEHTLRGGEADTQERSQRHGMEVRVDARRSRGATLHRRMVMSDAAMAEAARTRMLVTLEVSQLLRGWLNNLAPSHVRYRVVTCPTSQLFSGWSKDLAETNV